MEYMRLEPLQQNELLDSLLGMPAYLQARFSGLSAEQIAAPGPGGLFSPVEQAWHLADLEREGFGQRIRRLLTESEPDLPDFDGAKVAADRGYRSLSLEEGMAVFAEARRTNVSILRSIEAGAWFRSGRQEGVGKVSLCDMPSFMSQHDAAHRHEIETWRAQHRSS